MSGSTPENEPDEDRPAAAAGLRYLCVCGHGVDLRSDPGGCPRCGRPIPAGVASDPTMTVTLCAPLDSAAASDRTPERGAADATAPADPTPLGGDATVEQSGHRDDADAGSVASDPGGGGSRVAAGRGTALAGGRRRLGHFVLQEQLGSGGMGSVYRALDTSLERYVAVKVLRGPGEGSSASSTRSTDRLRREAVAQARLNHPRVVTIYYVGREEEEPFLAMELLPGPTLQQRLVDDGPLAYHEVIELALQVTDALEAADQRGLVHGDIKPSNLLMAGPRAIKLGDFGLARRSGSTARDGAVSGTPNYMAPELVEGQPPNRHSDMYALGVTLFELTFGRRPFALRGDSLRKRLQSHQQAPIEFPDKWPPEIPEQFRDVLARLLAKEPTERYEDYAGLREELRAVTPVGSTPAARLPRALAWLTDLAILSILQAPLVLPATILGFAGGEAAAAFADLGVGIPFGLVEFAFGLLGLFGWVAIPLLALWWDLRRWRTPGRYLLQLRVVDEHGLAPPRRVVMLRSVLRYMEFWVAALFCLPLVLALPAATIIEETLGRAWMLIDALFIFGPTRRTLHDRICRTHVVLDERSVPKLRVDQLGS